MLCRLGLRRRRNIDPIRLAAPHSGRGGRIRDRRCPQIQLQRPLRPASGGYGRGGCGPLQHRRVQLLDHLNRVVQLSHRDLGTPVVRHRRLRAGTDRARGRRHRGASADFAISTRGRAPTRWGGCGGPHHRDRPRARGGHRLPVRPSGRAPLAPSHHQCAPEQQSSQRAAGPCPLLARLRGASLQVLLALPRRVQLRLERLDLPGHRVQPLGQLGARIGRHGAHIAVRTRRLDQLFRRAQHQAVRPPPRCLRRLGRRLGRRDDRRRFLRRAGRDRHCGHDSRRLGRAFGRRFRRGRQLLRLLGCDRRAGIGGGQRGKPQQDRELPAQGLTAADVERKPHRGLGDRIRRHNLDQRARILPQNTDVGPPQYRSALARNRIRQAHTIGAQRAGLGSNRRHPDRQALTQHGGDLRHSKSDRRLGAAKPRQRVGAKRCHRRWIQQQRELAADAFVATELDHNPQRGLADWLQAFDLELTALGVDRDAPDVQ